jgi:hypothetical protein
MILLAFCLFKAVNAQLGWSDRTDIVFAILTASSLLIIGHKERSVLFLITSIVLIDLVLLVLRHYCNESTINGLSFLITIVFLILMTNLCLYFTLKDKTISVTTLFGSLSAYLFIGLVFAYLYLFVEWLSPMSFSQLNTAQETQAMYFSFITLTTVGFGEIVPLKPIAQTLVWFEAFIGQSYLALIIGQLIGRYVAEQIHLKG